MSKTITFSDLQKGAADETFHLHRLAVVPEVPFPAIGAAPALGRNPSMAVSLAPAFLGQRRYPAAQHPAQVSRQLQLIDWAPRTEFVVAIKHLPRQADCEERSK